ncbi:hypothetical protein EMIT047CA2_150067 [Pseudomonas soli]
MASSGVQAQMGCAQSRAVAQRMQGSGFILWFPCQSIPAVEVVGGSEVQRERLAEQVSLSLVFGPALARKKQTLVRS